MLLWHAGQAMFWDVLREAWKTLDGSAMLVILPKSIVAGDCDQMLVHVVTLPARTPGLFWAIHGLHFRQLLSMSAADVNGPGTSQICWIAASSILLRSCHPDESGSVYHLMAGGMCAQVSLKALCICRGS